MPKPDLTGAEIADVAREGDDLIFWLENVRTAGLVRAGIVRLHGIHAATSHEDRYADNTYPLQPGLTIRKATWTPNHLHLACLKPTGPGDADEPTFNLPYATLTNDLRPSLTRTLRALANAYPTWPDRNRRLPGPGRVEIADLS